MIGNALISLHLYPDQLDKLRAHPELLPRAVSECMRYDSSVQLVRRMAVEETEVDGVTLPKGTIVFMPLGAANRDPAHLDKADKLVIERPETTNRSIMFGGGIHYCLGARLATLELETALETLLKRMPNLRLTNLHDLQWHSRNTRRETNSAGSLVTRAVFPISLPLSRGHAQGLSDGQASRRRARNASWSQADSGRVRPRHTTTSWRLGITLTN